MAQHILALMNEKGRVALEEIQELREALEYADHGGKVSRPSVSGVDWVAEARRKSQVKVLGAGVQGSVITLPDASASALREAVAESGDEVAGMVMKHTTRHSSSDSSDFARLAVWCRLLPPALE